MVLYAHGNTKAIVIFHEIYGVNDFIKDTCQSYVNAGYDVICPDLYDGHVFSYGDSQAFAYYKKYGTFQAQDDRLTFIKTLYRTYQHVFLLGFSAGATLAWNCSSVYKLDGVICCYGSRIREYTQMQPQCPVLAIFASEDSFDVESVVEKLAKQAYVQTIIIQAKHGFMDIYAPSFHKEQASLWNEKIRCFMKFYIKDS